MKLSPAFLRFLTWQQILATGSVFAYLLLKTTVSAAATKYSTDTFSSVSLDRSSLPKAMISRQQLIAGADNFNPDLKLSAPREYIPLTLPLTPTPLSGGNPNTTNKSTTTGASSNNAGTPFILLEELKPNIRNDWNNSGQVNRIIEETATFRLNNGDRLFFTTGYNTYEQAAAKTVVNIPFQIDWETKVNSLKFRQGIGLDLLSGANTANFNVKIDYPVTSGLNVSMDLQQGAYKFNATTIENKVSALRYGPSIFWQIDKETSLFSSLKLGNYSDNNQEQQSFSRIERKMGSFSLAGNLFTWNYKNSTDKGYFAPPDFLVYSGELAWVGDVIQDALRCQLSVSIGQQHVNSKDSDAGGYQTKCTAKISSNIEADFGYSSSSIQSTIPTRSNANSQSITTQIRLKF
jgi:hypothetical protein